MVLLSIWGITGCASSGRVQLLNVSGRPQDCACLIDRLDQVIIQNKVANAGAARVNGFPYLRADRFLSAIAPKNTNDRRFLDWLNLMRNKADYTIEKEILNLPPGAVERLAGEAQTQPERQALIKNALDCNAIVFNHDIALEGYRDAVFSVIHVPHEYSFLMRAAGLYPIFSLPVAYLTYKAHKEFKGWFDTPETELPVLGQLTCFVPKVTLSTPVNVPALFALAQRNSFDMPLFSVAALEKLAFTFAPHLVQDVSGTYDIPGKVTWQNAQVTIDTDKPTLYYYASYARLAGRTVIQMNYVAWFSAREGPFAPWIERGPLDGLTIRLTLDHMGTPLMLDIMNNCGCYHMLIPQRDLVVKQKDKPFAIDAFIPQSLPPEFPDSPLGLRINSGWHQVQQVTTYRETTLPATAYTLLSYDELESLPQPDGRFESVFNHRGIMKDSWRIEPYILFSMGIPSVGVMRQRGHHAIVLVGREYFDNPDLFDDSLVFK